MTFILFLAVGNTKFERPSPSLSEKHKKFKVVSTNNPSELRRKLEKLGSRKSAQKNSRVRKSVKPSSLPHGIELKTAHGPTFRMQREYERDFMHGRLALSHVLTFSADFAAEVVQQPNFRGVDLEDIVFLDTETTGLAGGAGTLIFLVGLGRFRKGKFQLRQYFLRDPAEEAGMLEALHADLKKASAFVTYNGRAFDLPLLETRFTMALRERVHFGQSPHMDLLHLARRLWKRSLPNCTLGTVEKRILGVQRTEEDVPGSWIPGMYLDYLRTRDSSEMKRVIYHNTIDILSLASLAGVILQRHRFDELESLSAGEALAVARWHGELGRRDSAATAFQKAAGAKDEILKIEALRRFGSHLKKEGRREEALKHWRDWHQLAANDPTPCVEIAKYFEWQVKDFAAAREWAQKALDCLTYWPADWRQERAWEEIEHRLQRLGRKI